MSNDLITTVHDLVLESPIGAKAIAQAVGKPYSTLLREVNPYDTGAKLGARDTHAHHEDYRQCDAAGKDGPGNGLSSGTRGRHGFHGARLTRLEEYLICIQQREGAFGRPYRKIQRVLSDS